MASRETVMWSMEARAVLRPRVRQGPSTTVRSDVEGQMAKAGWALVLGLVLGLVLALPAAASAHHGSDTATVFLGLWPAGKGKIQASLEETGVVIATCDSEDPSVNEGGNPCFVEVSQGSRVSLEAEGGAGSPFVRWSRFDCEGTGPCTIAVEETEELVVATFRDQTLEVLINGTTSADAVTSSTGDLSCLEENGRLHCTASVEAGTDVVLTAQDAHTWGKGCEPGGDDPASPTCELTMTNLRTFATVGFGVDPPDLPFDIRVKLRVQKRGSGHGRITGQGKDGNGDDWRIDCGGSCSAENLEYQRRVTLLAEPDPGSEFVRWLGACSTESVCRVSAGAANVVAAVFSPLPPPPVPPRAPPPLPPTHAPATAAPFAAKVTKVSLAAKGRSRTVLMRVRIDRPAKATFRLVRKRTVLGTRKFALGAGTTLVRFRLPPRLKLGWYRVTARFVSNAGEIDSLSWRIRLRR
jgi:Divergent InlB B-repeat domain